MRAFTRFTISVAAALAPLAAVAAGTDGPLRIIQTVDPIYPISNETLSLPPGEVHVVVAVDETGTLTDWLVTRFTRREFADSAVAAIKDWRFVPARLNGVPFGVRRELRFVFEARKAVVSLQEIDQIGRRLELLFGPSLTECVVAARELDAPLRVTQAVRPRHPTPETARGGTAVVDYYVDAEGRPRMPVVVSGDAESLGAAAVEALEQTRFAAPLARGRPTAVRVRQEFRFAAGS